MPHDVLLEGARINGYPLWLLELSLAAYRLARSVDGVYSRLGLVVASRGITAGSGFATTQLNVMMIDLVNMLQADGQALSPPKSSLTISRCLLLVRPST